MIINHSLKLIFLHIPKNAGTSVTAWLSQYTDWNDIELGGTHYGEQIQPIYGKRFKLNKHSPAKQIHGVIGNELWERYYKFAIVRHPFDRLVSAYHFYLKWEHPSVKAVKDFPDFTAFVRSEYFAQDHLNCTRATGLQSQFLETDQEIAKIDKLCRFESIQTDLNEVASILKIQPPKLPHTNRSYRGDYNKYFNPDTRALAERIYLDDFRNFGYQSE